MKNDIQTKKPTFLNPRKVGSQNWEIIFFKGQT